MSFLAAVPLISSALSFLGGERRNTAQEELAQQQMDYQSAMSNTAYQRAVADMKAAGINPMLAARVGGASSPMGAMAQVMDTVTPAVQSGMGAYTGIASAQAAESQAVLSSAQARLADSQIELNSEQKQVVSNTAQKIILETSKISDERFVLQDTLRNLASQRQLMQDQGANLNAQAAVAASTIDRLRADTANITLQAALNKLDLEAAENFFNLGRQFRELKPLIDLLRFVFRARGG